MGTEDIVLDGQSQIRQRLPVWFMEAYVRYTVGEKPHVVRCGAALRTASNDDELRPTMSPKEGRSRFVKPQSTSTSIPYDGANV